MSRTMTVSDSAVVAADPIALWTAVADPTQMPRWSPENTGARVAGEPHPLAVGDTFLGTNRRGWMRWRTRCRVTVSEPGRCFEFRVQAIGVRGPLVPARIATWRYEFQVADDATLVTETWTDDRTSWSERTADAFDRAVTGGRTFADFQRRNIARTLAALQADFE